jgi:hypothetical protein
MVGVAASPQSGGALAAMCAAGLPPMLGFVEKLTNQLLRAYPKRGGAMFNLLQQVGVQDERACVGRLDSEQVCTLRDGWHIKVGLQLRPVLWQGYRVPLYAGGALENVQVPGLIAAMSMRDQLSDSTR